MQLPTSCSRLRFLPALAFNRCRAPCRHNLQQSVALRPCRRGPSWNAMAAASTMEGTDSGSRVIKRTYSGKWTGEDLDADYGVVAASAPSGRRAGVVLHPTSLPGPYGIGEIGKEAFRFVDWLVSAGMQLWQVLPLVPPEEVYWSPYSGLDALCGSVLFIALDELVEAGLLDAADLPAPVPSGPVDYPKVQAMKGPLLTKAADCLLNEAQFASMREAMGSFRRANAWVEDSALFHALTHYEPELEGKAWWDWPEPMRFRDKKAVALAREKFAPDIERFIALQFLFDMQWKAVKAYANSRGVLLMGDLPIYVGGQSADVWAYQGLFELGPSGAPAIVAGVPPDAFSATGQLWGNPLYDWKAQKADGFKWWVQRMARSFQLYDETRVDHFRGFAGYYAVDATAETAMEGTWKKGPSTELFEALEKELGAVPIVAEDLGVITADVVALRKAIGAPGMVVLQFAWGSDGANVHLPHNHYENCVVYPGTHDNETAAGWWADSASEKDRAYLTQYLQFDGGGADLADTFTRAAYASVAKTAIVMIQDLMGLDNSARINLPGSTGCNWSWRITEPDIWAKLAGRAAELKQMAELYNRLPDNQADLL